MSSGLGTHSGKGAVLSTWAPLRVLIDSTATPVKLPGPLQLEFFIGDVMTIAEAQILATVGTLLLAAIGYVGYTVKRSASLSATVRSNILLLILPCIAIAPLVFLAIHGPLRSLMSQFSISFVSVLGFFKWIELICGTCPKGADKSAKNFTLYYASPAEVLFDAEGEPQTVPSGRIMELIQSLVPHLVVFVITCSLGYSTAFTPFLAQGTDGMNMPFLGFPVALPAVYLQTVMAYSMLACTTLFHRLVLAFAGFDTVPAMRHPLLLSKSIKEFWGRRWNMVIHNLMWRSFFKPLAARGGLKYRHAGAFLAFVMSGLFHEYMWLITNWFHMDTYTVGLPLLFFLIQFVLTAIESILAKTWLGLQVARLPGPVRTICTTFVVLPFGPIFLQGIYLMSVDCASSLPTLRSQV